MVCIIPYHVFSCVTGWDCVLCCIIITVMYDIIDKRINMGKKILAIVGALIGGGLGIAILGTGTQVAQAGVQFN